MMTFAIGMTARRVSGAVVVCAAFAAAAPSVLAQAPLAHPASHNGVEGVWFDHSGRGAIEIVACGARLCGYIYWVKDTTRQGKPVVDKLNPDPKRRDQPICGTRILANLTPNGALQPNRVWTGGQIYNPEEGESFDAEITLITPERLSVLGYAGIKMFGETFTWTRAPTDLVRCGPPRV